MAKPVKTQWDFGDLFQPRKEPARKVLSVTELTWQIKRLLESEMGQIWVTGEITNLRAQPSGHIYFTIKDAGAQLSCVLFRGESQADRSLIQDGQKVTLRGDVTVYETRGQYQLRVTKVELQGVGALQAAFENLKQKLKAEGLFAPGRKRPLPRYPQRIGLVTSLTGAAIRDVLHVVQRRNASLEIVLVPSRVQGEGAAEEIANAIQLLNEFHLRSCQRAEVPASRGGLEESRLAPVAAQAGLDLILITRGGGSLEDLWAFNEEVVARAVFESALPVVSAVGHEIDFTISDFVADVRAATPSAAAEIITEGVFSSCQFLSEANGRIRELASQQMQRKHRELTQMTQRLARVHPRRRLGDWLQRLDDAQTGLLRYGRQGARRQQIAWQNLSDRLARVRPAMLLKYRREVVQQAGQRLKEQARHRIDQLQNHLGTVQTRLRLLGPEQVLARGYSISMKAETGEVVRNAGLVQTGQRLRTRLQTGELHSRVEEKPQSS